MDSSALALEQLNKWKTASKSLLLSIASEGITVWCVGVLHHVSRAELHFGSKLVSEEDLLFTLNLHDAKFLFVEDGPIQLFPHARFKGTFGSVLQITLRPGARVTLAELLSDVIEMENHPSDSH